MKNIRQGSEGHSLIEFALVFPLLFLLIVNVVNFGGLLYCWITVASAARSGAHYMMLGGASAHAPALQDAETIRSVVKADFKFLPYSGATNPQVRICTNNQASGTAKVESPPGECLASVTDPEPTTSVIGAVEVSYTYCPFIRFWEWPALHIHSTLPACTITSGTLGGGTPVRQVAVMRILQ